ncbi:YbaB/EbfC family DNA-binding protein [Micromonospora chersina]|uniref:YbaB/EbfC family DNA-binding protein n=1 Tax=Micromonospora chersina TaxID=47854 RepID=UPI003715B1B6
MRPSSEGFAEMLDQVVAAASMVQEAATGGAEPVRTSAANGWVEAELGADGRLAALTLDPGLKGLPMERVAAAIVEAVNAALNEQQAQRGHGAPAVDLSEMMAQLKQVQEAAVPQMRSFVDALTRAQQDAAARASRQ